MRPNLDQCDLFRDFGDIYKDPSQMDLNFEACRIELLLSSLLHMNSKKESKANRYKETTS